MSVTPFWLSRLAQLTMSSAAGARINGGETTPFDEERSQDGVYQAFTTIPTGIEHVDTLEVVTAEGDAITADNINMPAGELIRLRHEMEYREAKKDVV